MKEILATTAPQSLPYLPPVAILQGKGYILGGKKVKSFAGLASSHFAIKKLLYRNRSIQILDPTQL
jgi:hypothetical protein